MARSWRFWIAGSAALWLIAIAERVPVMADEAVQNPPRVDFVRDVQPILVEHCFKCHGATRQEAGLRLNLRDAALAGGDSGQKAIVPGDPKASRLVKVIDGSDVEITMPPEDEGKPLSKEQVELITGWVREGANWPAGADDPAARPDHWAWKKPAKAALPSVARRDWPRRAIDYFVLERIEKAQISPAPEADRHTLARRVWLDLVGLPPASEVVEAFVDDQRPDAYEWIVERALADPGYGERWARMWLDLARYADSKGYGSDPLRTIWRYRDWVIEAFNRNLPYDRFTIEQLAGDLLPQPTSDQLLATAFHRNTMANDEGGTDDEEFRVAAVKDRIETTMQVWMGLTMGCAKCHSHKFDPITQREYYQGYAFFDQTEDADRGDEEPRMTTPTRLDEQRIAERCAQIAALERQLATPPAGLDADVAAWEQSVRDQDKQWTVLVPSELAADDSVSLERLPDYSILASGANPQKNTYRISVVTTQQHMTAFRLDALPHEGLPAGGPGRAAGNFVLSEFQVAAAHSAGRPRGRFVRVEIPGENKLLSLAEVQVFENTERPENAENIAPHGTARQSSTALGAGAERAIDDQTDGNFDKGSVTHTNDEKNPWWEVDLGRAATLARIAVWNRTDHDLESRLKDFELTVLDENRKPVWQRRVTKAPKPSMDFDLTEPTQIELAGASADFSQSGFEIGKATDSKIDDQSGWAISPQFGKPHYAVFPAKDIVEHGPKMLTFTLVQSYGGGHTLGRFRLSATTQTPPPSAIDGHIGEILALASDARSTEQRSELTKYYWLHSAAADALRTQIGQLTSQIKGIEEQISATPIMRELAADKRRVTHTMIKGNFRSPGDVVAPAVPVAFHPLPAGTPTNRLGLAQWLVDRDNPLTARVAVNRFWAQLMGVGLVATEEDFGTQGLPPTHPELLDWLAVEFMDQGWDVKQLLREIVTSATYRQSSTPAPATAEKDPENRLLARGPRLRLDAETVRDQALAISGLLSRTQGGPSVYPPQPDGLWRAAFNSQRTWATSTGDDRYRRGMYTYWRRTVPYPSMAAFDAPSREICTLRRISTNTPLQAFVTLNDPVYVEAAQALARRMVAEGGESEQDRAALGLRLALVRPPRAEQIDALATLHRSALANYQKDPDAAKAMATNPLGPLPTGYDTSELAAWTVVANVILNLDGVLAKR